MIIIKCYDNMRNERKVESKNTHKLNAVWEGEIIMLSIVGTYTISDLLL